MQELEDELEAYKRLHVQVPAPVPVTSEQAYVDPTGVVQAGYYAPQDAVAYEYEAVGATPGGNWPGQEWGGSPPQGGWPPGMKFEREGGWD